MNTNARLAFDSSGHPSPVNPRKSTDDCPMFHGGVKLLAENRAHLSTLVNGVDVVNARVRRGWSLYGIFDPQKLV